jgi:phosphonate transport system permease protein
MPSAIVRLPPHQLARARAAYRAATAPRLARGGLAAAVLAVLVALAADVGEVDLGKLVANIHRFPDYIRSLVPPLGFAHLRDDLADWFWNADHWLSLLLDTVLIAYLGTLLAAAGAFALCFLAAQNLEKRPVVRFAARRCLEFCRTVPEIVFALIFVAAFGLGALPGVLALAVHGMGALGKLYAEVVESIDGKPIEGVASAGGGWWSIVRFAVLPQMLPNFASYTLLRFEINVRAAAVIGFVGAGGIGQDLMEAIRKFYYADISAMLVLIIGAVVAIDLVTEQLRHRLIGLERAR